MQKNLQMDNSKPLVSTWFVAAWFGASIITLIFSLTFVFYLTHPKTVKPKIQSFKLYAALPKSGGFILDEISQSDGRAKIIEDFFKSYKSPLASYSKNFVEVADKYNLNWRLLPAIAMQESAGGKKTIKNSYNPFGYGIYDKLVTSFNSWDEAIETVGKGLKENYLNKGLKTPYQIMTKYTPPSVSKGDAWAKAVSSFIAQLQ